MQHYITLYYTILYYNPIHVCIYIYIYIWERSTVRSPYLAHSMLKKVFSPAREYMFWITCALMQARTPFHNMTWLLIVKLELSCRREHEAHIRSLHGSPFSVRERCLQNIGQQGSKSIVFYSTLSRKFKMIV